MKPMKNILLSIFSLSLLLAACSGEEGDKQTQLAALKKQQTEIAKQIATLEATIAAENPDAVKQKSKEVGVLAVAPAKFDYFVQTQGQVTTDNNVLVSAKSMGVVTKVFAREGQVVSKGQTLAQIDNAAMVSNLESMKAQLELVNTVFERQQKLWEQKIGTEIQYLQAKTNKESLEKQIAAMQEQIDMTKIQAPISGTVDGVMVKVGENIVPGMPALRIVNNTDLRIKAAVSEAYVTQIKTGNSVIVQIPELKKDIRATVSFVGKSIDVLSRTFPVEINLPNDPALRPNMTAVIKVIFHQEAQAITVPINVIQDLNSEKIVFIAEASGKNTIARKKVVTIKGVYDNKAHVEGLAAGEKVITVGYQGLSDGQLIKI
jgi:membrane fusion protein (multidrug efflux system)